MGEILNLRRGLAQIGSVTSAESRPAAQGASFDALAMLLADVALGNERAFARLYELTGGRLLVIARGIVGSRDVAEDVLQEAFVRVWRWADRYDPAKGPAYAWLVRVVRNRALSARTRQQRRGEQAVLDVEELIVEGPSPADQAMHSEEARQVKSCLANLPLNHRRSVALVYFEGLTHRELAERLGVQLGTAKSWVRRGLAQMSRCLTGGNEAGWRELMAAEYAAGSLHGAARRGFERRRERDARYCRAVDVWEDRFAALTEYLPPETAPLQIWSRIAQQVGRSRIGFSRPLLWQATSGLLALVVVGLLVAVLR